jgi:hypothetical protein
MDSFQGEMPKRGMRILLTLFQRVSTQVHTQIPQAVRAISSSTNVEVIDSMALVNQACSFLHDSHSRYRSRFGRLLCILKIGQFNSIFLSTYLVCSLKHFSGCEKLQRKHQGE